MLTLFLLRHAKSSWDDPALDDHDRPLAVRGEKAAPRIGAFMARERLRPDLILCSTAMRARQTLALALVELTGPRAEVRYEDELYHATPTELIERLRALGKGPPHVMIVGHNPGLHALALELTGKGERRAIVRLARKLATGALAVIALPGARSWADARPAGGELKLLVQPRDLE